MTDMVDQLDAVTQKLRDRDSTDDTDITHIHPNCADAICELVDRFDERKRRPRPPKGQSHRSPTTLYLWTRRLTLMAKQQNLLTATPDSIERDLDMMYDGTHPFTRGDASDGGLSKSSLRSYETALRAFYKLYNDAVDYTDIPIDTSDTPSIDPDDILTKEEIHHIRESTQSPRNKLIFDLLVYTGSRREVIVTWRIKDIDPEKGTYTHNNTANGLKGVLDRPGERPLLAATATVREWLNTYHPDTPNPDPERYLITPEPQYCTHGGKEPLHRSSVNKVMQRIKKNSGITKPLNPHQMRHCFTTICKRDYKMSDDTIKYLLGHSEDSNIMNEVYSHLTSTDHLKNAQKAAGVIDESEEETFTPEICRTCSNPLPPNAKACPTCGMVYSPTAHSVSTLLEEGMVSDAKKVNTEMDEEQFDVLYELLKEHKGELLNRLENG